MSVPDTVVVQALSAAPIVFPDSITVVTPSDGGLLSSPLIQTALGGALTIIGGTLAIFLQDRLARGDKAFLIETIVLDGLSAQYSNLVKLGDDIDKGRPIDDLFIEELEKTRTKYEKASANIIHLRPRWLRPKVTQWYRTMGLMKPVLERYRRVIAMKSLEQHKDEIRQDMLDRMTELVVEAQKISVGLGAPLPMPAEILKNMER